jgi:alpha-L-rhamnosidase
VAVGAHVAKLRIALGPDNGLALLRALHAAGRDADVRRILTDPSGPGWAHIVATGGSFTWETWAPDDADGDSTSYGWGSSALAAYSETFLGLKTAPRTGAPTGARLELSQPPSGPNRVAGRVSTVSGPIYVGWQRSGGTVSLRLRVPANASVSVRLRARGAADVSESGHPLRDGHGIRVTGTGRGSVDLTVGPGRASFRIS